MLNKKPIFLVGFARGGSNIILNFLVSHPHVCSPRGEIHQIFRGRLAEPLHRRLHKRLRYLPIALVEGRARFAVENWQPREPASPLVKRTVDSIFYADKRRMNREKTGSATIADESRARLTVKNLNGTILVTDMLNEMYPDATFIGLVRNGLAVCEGWSRRGEDIRTAAEHYRTGAHAIRDYAERLPNFHLIRYEDVVTKPAESLQTIFALCDLDIALVERIKQQTKQVITETGEHQFVKNAQEKQRVYYTLDNLDEHFRTDANDNQIARLTDDQRQTIMDIAGDSLRALGYLD